jgi:hypothetical protein
MKGMHIQPHILKPQSSITDTMALTQLPIYVIHIILIVCSDTPVSSHVMQIAGLVYVAVSTCPA